MSDFRQTLRSRIREDHLTCPICFSPFTTPKALPCLHTFCEGCLRDYITGRGYEALGQFPCPVCRAETAIPPGGVHHFQDNYLVTSLSDTVETAKETPKLPPRPSPNAVRKAMESAQDGRASPSQIPPVPQRPQSITPPPHPHHYTVGTVSSLIKEGVTGAIGHVGSALSDMNPLKQHKGDTAGDHHREGANLGWSVLEPPGESGQGRSSPNLYPQLSIPSDVSGPCTDGMLLKFGQYGAGISDFLKPYGFAVGRNGEFVVTDRGGNRIFVFDNSGQLQCRFNLQCTVNDIAITRDNNILIAVSKSGSSIMRLCTMQGRPLQSFGDYYKFDTASGITINSKHQVAITNLAADNVLVFTEQHKFSTKFGRKGTGDNHFMQPHFIASTNKGYVAVSDTGSHMVKILDTAGVHKRSFGGKGDNHGQLDTPMGIAVDADDNIIVADWKNFRVQMFTNKGQYFTTFLKETNLIGPDVRPFNVAVTPRNNIAVLLLGTGFAEVRVFGWRDRVAACNV